MLRWGVQFDLFDCILAEFKNNHNIFCALLCLTFSKQLDEKNNNKIFDNEKDEINENKCQTAKSICSFYLI